MAKILVVDDDPTFVKLTTALIKNAGHSVYTATNGQAAFASLEKIKPDLLVLDVMMPGLDGYEIAHRIKSDPRLEDMPIILFSSLSIQSDPETSALIGIDCLHKSCKPQELMDKIAEILQRKPLQEEAKKKLIEENFKDFFEYDHHVSEGLKRIIEFRIQRSLKNQSDGDRYLQD